ncbi:acetyltransferase [Adhaeribacter pallidiroseus]|uniref:Acyl-(Acyl-carrier-protein)--UDP-N-acetylglucosamine O-acyltransferase n=1 Tax=Adhaeribacter pallidiroseus TaxID=2072847 RepID=A0A369QI80_9BACT|nr:acetyltransferase [Adhaeribacter pallidiroseus]RDC64122.1 Acyl-(acyl-carrier-protein)--UDP-N-acetylglucosamine O-acyltransferase [Adhaeribacter pallidiroseus]
MFGDSAFAEIAYEYFSYDSEYEVMAFTVSKEFIKKDSLFGLPIVAFEEVDKMFDPSFYEMHIAITYDKINRIRIEFYKQAKEKGYKLANYISSKAFVWRNVDLGDNCFIFEDNTIQPFVKIGSNNVFWSGNHIGHHSSIGSHNFISSHVVISGFCEIGNANFIGVNATMANNLTIGNDCLIGSSVHIVKSVKDGSLIKGTPNYPVEKSTYELFRIDNL